MESENTEKLSDVVVVVNTGKSNDTTTSTSTTTGTEKAVIYTADDRNRTNCSAASSRSSVVHQHYNKSMKSEDGSYRAQCRHCLCSLKGARFGTTSNLLNHLKVGCVG